MPHLFDALEVVPHWPWKGYKMPCMTIPNRTTEGSAFERFFGTPAKKCLTSRKSLLCFVHISMDRTGVMLIVQRLKLKDY
jgi:hypothetical protein